MFVDESGDHSMDPINQNYPIFVLSLCIIKRRDYTDNLAPRIKSLKIDYFGHDLAILHEHDILRKKSWFSRFGPKEREELMARLGEIIEETPFHLIAIIIDKERHKKKYVAPQHPYHLALQLALERLAGFLRSRGERDATVNVVCEARGNKEDSALELAFRQVCDGENFKGERYPYSIVIADKKCNSEGLQLADLIARPVGLSHLRPDQENRAYEILKAKFCANYHGNFHGIGRKVFP
ncbi:DUF3800 domain-containing protein [Castellaniella sp. WN]